MALTIYINYIIFYTNAFCHTHTYMSTVNGYIMQIPEQYQC